MFGLPGATLAAAKGGESPALSQYIAWDYGVSGGWDLYRMCGAADASRAGLPSLQGFRTSGEDHFILKLTWFV